jgi:hypothetical protein
MFTRIILIATLLMLAGCRDEEVSSKSAEEARIEKEVKQRVKVAEKALKVGQTRMHTIRITAFVLLAGGSIALFVRLQRQRGFHPTPIPERLPPVTRWMDHHAIPTTRVIETHPPEPVDGQRRNRSPSQATRNPPNSNRRRNQRHAP